MKINWGTGIVIAFALFMGFILFFVFRVQSDHKYDNELVVEEYYKQEKGLQEKLDKEKNAAGLPQKVQIQNTPEAIKIIFPKGFDIHKIKGKVSFYRPSDRKLDFEIPISLPASYLLIPKSDLAGGRWDITVDWQYEGKGYLSTAMLML
ncbi:cytochrome C oxidase Cbb3 [Flavobacterium cyanobacteriorum]|uniref:Cytochrome C oxidase Cbb3 n=1 Tax=Flavobacterium cyanobacteriorum TaxID=2022802 RepID=A0A255Z2A7_9FLAO|nr:FixH family protein [Flavobacterium cyanobacteriorum]OYQ35044.1 cytochrome C oxidase Cbb3 [Flavobacterium cyanobacteriorum]